MPRTGSRGGPQTRAKIAEVAAGLFLEQGFDAVTVADIAKAAGVSSVTVFKHFPRKEDLFLDRQNEADLEKQDHPQEPHYEPLIPARSRVRCTMRPRTSR